MANEWVGGVEAAPKAFLRFPLADHDMKGTSDYSLNLNLSFVAFDNHERIPVKEYVLIQSNATIHPVTHKRQPPTKFTENARQMSSPKHLLL